MKVFLTASSQVAKTTRQRNKLDEVKFLLDKHEDIRKRRFLRQLAECLLFPDSYLISAPAPLLSSLIAEVFEFLETKTDNISIQDSPLTNKTNRLFLIGSPNISYAVESILALQKRYGFSFQLLAHPVLAIRRQGNNITYLGDDSHQGEKELFIILKQENVHDSNDLLLENEIRRTLLATLNVARDHSLLVDKMDSMKQIEGISDFYPFIDWLKDDVFIPFAYQKVSSEDTEISAILNNQLNESGAGIEIDLCYQENDQLAGGKFLSELEKILKRETNVIVQVVSVHGPVLNYEPLIYIGFREKTGENSWYEHLFLGLFKDIELNGPASKVPALCHKIDQTLLSTKLFRGSHDFLRLQELFNIFPKVELFFLGETQFYILTQSLIRYLHRPDNLKLLFLASASPERLSIFIIIPKLLFKEGIEYELQKKVCQELSCKREVCRKIISGGGYIGVQLIVIPTKEENHIDINALERKLNRLARPWTLKLRFILERAFGREKGAKLWQKYQLVFPVDYQALMPPRYAVKDIIRIERILQGKCQNLNLLNPCHYIKDYRLHFYSNQETFLDEYLPVLENLNLRLIDQVQFSIIVDGAQIFIKSFTIKTVPKQSEPLHKLRLRILNTIQAILDGKADNDVLNGLLVLTGMTWKEIDILRAYRNYFLQLGYHSTMASFHQALINNPHIARYLYEYFEVRFRPDPEWDDPGLREEQALFPLRMKLLESIEKVSGINDDRILRTLFNLIDATVRSNFHVRRELDDYFISFKVNSLGVIDMPAPRPQYEIYVHAADMEGIHLRGGLISRGGIRWSDRPDDFRTEILGLMQTQMSKNALIIPKGAKGGFVVKKLREDESFKEAGKRAYMTLIRGLLDLTDNYYRNRVVRLPGIVNYDHNDPYLVVAADKGTAQFPDIANSVAGEYRYWLGEAFASGGSKGYNHKALGITARGAWESVKRHFRELGRDIQTEPFTTIGIGSMDGDVFGNGMLLSHQTRLLAAISGQHIFIDPDPTDSEESFLERKRLFEMPGSSWDDYDRGKISEGGGVFHRGAKDIPVSPTLRKWLGIRYRSVDGETLIRYLLTAQVDLLWLGGIGTYVKASTEKQEDAGDRSNDNVRVDAKEIRATIVGEGANLGFTQKARIECSLNGGKINTDAIDNSAGVDISDHEVNLKILLYDLQKKEIISDFQELFSSLANDVCRTVLANNYDQGLCLSLDLIRCNKHPERFLELADHLESTGLLDRAVESFPRFKEVNARQGQKLTRPELAVLMAVSKIQLTELIQEHQDFVTAEFCELYLQSYFPEQIKEKYNKYLSGHPLANNIKATYISNKLINQAGCLFLNLVVETGSEDIIDCVAAYLTFDRVLSGYSLRQDIFELDNKADAEKQYSLLIRLENLLAGFCRWCLLHDKKVQPNEETIARYIHFLEEYEEHFKDHYCIAENTEYQNQIARYQKDQIPDDLAQRMIFISGLENFPLIVQLTIETERGFIMILSAFNETMVFLKLDAIYQHLEQISIHDHWEGKALQDLQEDMKITVSKIVRKMLVAGNTDCQEYFEATGRKQKINQYKRVCQEICTTLPLSLLPYITLSKELENLLD